MEKAETSEGGETSDLTRGRWIEEALTKLKKIHNSAQKLEISKELILDNERRQEDELLALEAIYQDNLHIFDKQDGLLFFQISLHCDVPEGLKVSAKFQSSISTGTFKPVNRTNADLLSDEKNLEERSLYSFEVQFMPPIMLTCMLPKSYPSRETPFFSIDTQWLDESKVMSIYNMLDSIWRDQLGQEVIFQWTEWLQSSSLSYLRFSEELVLHVPRHIIPFMISYNEKRHHEAFLNTTHQCTICLSDYLGSQFIKLPCEHLFCLNCMKTYARMHVKEGSVTKLSCPSRNCGACIPPIVLKRLLDSQEYERWESLLLQRTLDSMTDVVYCPRCQTVCLEDSGMNDAQCSKCFFSFCTLCKDKRHVGELCKGAEARLQIMQEEQVKSDRMTTNEQRRKEQELINEVLSVKEALRDAMQCPNCKIAISRTEGCSNMVCSNCDQSFCYTCGKPFFGYDHFHASKGGKLVEPIKWEEILDESQLEQVPAYILGDKYRQAIHPCPQCRQRNGKFGNNNHLLCSACRTWYCALCHKVVKRCSEHFSRKGCKQHTDDP